MNFKFSEVESSILGLRVYRGKSLLEHIGLKELESLLFDSKSDICKFKILATEEKVFDQLENLGFPYNLMTILYENVIPIIEKDGDYQCPEEIEYELFEGQEIGLVNEIAKDIVEDPSGTSYSIEEIAQLSNKKLQIEATTAYLLSFNTNERRMWLLKSQGNYVGCFMGVFEEEGFEGTMYAVKTKYRRNGFGHIIYKIMKKLCFENGAKYFRNEVQVQNIPSVKATVKAGLTPRNIYLHVSINSLLTYSKKASISGEVIFSSEDLKDIDNKIFQKVKEHELLKGFITKSFTYLSREKVMPEHRYTYELSFPVFDKDTVLAIYKLFDKEGKLIAAAYHKLIPQYF